MIDPTNIGCGRKLAIGNLHKIIESLRRSGRSAAGQPDCHITPLTHLPDSPALVSSIDRVVRFASDDAIFVEAAVRHCLNDLYAAGCEPIVVDGVLGFSQAEIDTERHISISQALFEVAEKLGFAVGKLHSVLDFPTSLTLTCIGISGGIGHAMLGAKGSIFITGEIGGLKASYLREIGNLDITERDVKRALLRDNSKLIKCIKACNATATDVSGFGCLYSLDQLLQAHQLQGSVDLDGVSAVHPLVSQIEVECLQVVADYAVTLQSNGLSNSTLGNLSELNGPMVVLVDEAMVAEFIKNVDGLRSEHSATRLGTWERMKANA